MRIVIIGSAGYLGSTLAETIKNKHGDFSEVIGVDPCLPGVDPKDAASLVGEFYQMPATKELLFEHLDGGFDAIVVSSMPETAPQMAVQAEQDDKIYELAKYAASVGVDVYLLGDRNANTSITPQEVDYVPVPNLYGYCPVQTAQRADKMVNRMVADVYESGQTLVDIADGILHEFMPVYAYAKNLLEFIENRKPMARPSKLPTIHLAGYVVGLLRGCESQTCKQAEFATHPEFLVMEEHDYHVEFLLEDQRALSEVIPYMVLCREREMYKPCVTPVRNRAFFYEQLMVFGKYNEGRKIPDASDIAPVAPTQTKNFGNKWL